MRWLAKVVSGGKSEENRRFYDAAVATHQRLREPGISGNEVAECMGEIVLMLQHAIAADPRDGDALTFLADTYLSSSYLMLPGSETHAYFLERAVAVIQELDQGQPRKRISKGQRQRARVVGGEVVDAVLDVIQSRIPRAEQTAQRLRNSSREFVQNCHRRSLTSALDWSENPYVRRALKAALAPQ